MMRNPVKPQLAIAGYSQVDNGSRRESLDELRGTGWGKVMGEGNVWFAG